MDENENPIIEGEETETPETPEEPDTPLPQRTEFLGLHDWQPEDIPTAEDWAGDNRTVDAFAQDADERLTAADARLTALEESGGGGGGTVVTINGEPVEQWNITMSTTDLTAGTSALPTGDVHFVYE